MVLDVLSHLLPAPPCTILSEFAPVGSGSLSRPGLVLRAGPVLLIEKCSHFLSPSSAHRFTLAVGHSSLVVGLERPVQGWHSGSPKPRSARPLSYLPVRQRAGGR